MKKPRIKKDYNKPGSYQIIGSLTKSKISKCDSVFLNVYITGYGDIGNSKMFLTTSDQLFTPTSKMYSSIYVDTNAVNDRGMRGVFNFGKDTMELNSSPVIVSNFGGVDRPGWKYKSQYIDASGIDSLPTTIITEIASTPPIKFALFPLQDIKPGDYNITLSLTYFNGFEWKASMQTLPIHINNFFENYPFFIPALSILAGIVALGGFVINIRTFIINFLLRPRTEKLKEVPPSSVTSPPTQPICPIPPGEIATDPKPETSEKVYKNRSISTEKKAAEKKARQEHNQKFVWKTKKLLGLFRSKPSLTRIPDIST